MSNPRNIYSTNILQDDVFDFHFIASPGVPESEIKQFAYPTEEQKNQDIQACVFTYTTRKAKESEINTLLCCCGCLGGCSCQHGKYKECGAITLCSLLGWRCGFNPLACFFGPFILCINPYVSIGKECGCGTRCGGMCGYFVGTKSCIAECCYHLYGNRDVDE